MWCGVAANCKSGVWKIIFVIIDSLKWLSNNKNNETEDTEFQIKNVKFEILRHDDCVAITDEMGGVYGVLSQDDCYLPLFEEISKF